MSRSLLAGLLLLNSSVGAAGTTEVAGTGQSPVEAAARLVSSALSCGRSKGDYQQVATR